ncbi:MAG: hypothetical protein J5517_10890 [Eubacterium sp.]|nr:hypothetical protein [Eubacterium sp.]
MNKESILAKCPTDIHKAFLEYAIGFFEEKSCKALLKGSICKGTAHRFSDIDLVLKRMDKETADSFIYGFGDVALISRTERPAGIIIVIYTNGLSLDLDFRDKITREEFENSDIIGNEFESEDIGEELSRCENILESEKTDEWESMKRLFHRSLIKWLGGKTESGYSILKEITDFMKNEKIDIPDFSGDYKHDFRVTLESYNAVSQLEQKYYSVIENLYALL